MKQLKSGKRMVESTTASRMPGNKLNCLFALKMSISISTMDLQVVQGTELRRIEQTVRYGGCP